MNFEKLRDNFKTNTFFSTCIGREKEKDFIL